MSRHPLELFGVDLFDQIPGLLAVYDRHAQVVFGNHAYLELGGPGSVGARHPPVSMQAFDEAGCATLAAMVQRALDCGQTSVSDITAIGRDGVRRPFAISVAARRDAQGQIGHAIVLGLDLSGPIGIRQRVADRLREPDVSAEQLPQNIIRYDLGGRATYVNRELGERYQIVGGSVIGRRPREVAPVGAPGMAEYERVLDHALATGEPGTVELPVLDNGGDIRVHSIDISAERDERGRISGALAVGRDVTEQARAREALAQKEREFRSLAENAGDVIIRWDTQAITLYVNPALDRLYQGKGHLFIGRRPTELARRNGQPMRVLEERVLQVAATARPDLMELRFKDLRTRQTVVHQIRIVPEFDAQGRVCSVLGVGRDITEKIAQLELIESLLHVDSLTQLANRRALRDRMAGLLSSAQRRQARVGLLLLDLDQFKAINDGLGHSAGDELLVDTARRLTGCARVEDMLARLGGDEFVLVAPDVDGPAAALALAERLHAAVSTPATVAGREVRVTMSVGVAVYPDDGASLEELLANADAAMYEAKRSGRGRSRRYTPAMGESVRRRLALDQSLRFATQRAELELHFQPKVDLSAAARVVGAEALVRWRHPAMGLLMPDQFVPLAEESEAIVELGRWVLQEAVRAVVRWNARAPLPLHVSVNVSPRQFRDSPFAEEVVRALADAGCDPSWLWIEVTEGALVSDARSLERALAELRCAGVRVSIDDFGTGYSALNYLARFPIDQLKIDKSFVRSVGRSPRDDELLKAFVAIAAALRLEVVAEGVETEEQAAFLLRHGCVQAQGYLYGRPVPESRFVRTCLGLDPPADPRTQTAAAAKP